MEQIHIEHIIKYKKQLTIITICLMLIVSLFSTILNVDAAKESLNKTNATVKIGNTVRLKVNNTSKTVKWSSSNKSVATVSSKGVVTGKKNGKTTISAKVNGKTLKCSVRVHPYELVTASDPLASSTTILVLIQQIRRWLDVELISDKKDY